MAKTTTTKITSLDVATARDLHKEMAAAMQDLATKYGVSIIQAGGTVGDMDFTAKFRVTVLDKGAQQKIAEKKNNSMGVAFKMYATTLGMDEAWLNQEFVSPNSGMTFKIIGLMPSRPKYPVVGEDTNGRRFKFTAPAVIAAFASVARTKAAKKTKKTSTRPGARF